MDLEEARNVLDRQIEKLRELRYLELKQLVEGRVIQTPEIVGPSGVRYYLEIQSFWDNSPEGNIRLIASIDDAGAHAHHPLTRGFIKAPDESFMGE